MRFSKSVVLAVALGVAVGAVSAGGRSDGVRAAAMHGKLTGGGTCAAVEASKAPFPAPPSVLDASCTAIPLTFPGDVIEQGNFDLYSWLTFVAVNWPANAKGCTANPKANIVTSAPNPTWLTYLNDDDVFVPAPKSPVGWCYAPTGVAGFASAGQATAAKRAARVAELPPAVRALAARHPEVRFFLSHAAKGARVQLALAKSGTSLGDPHLQTILDATQQVVTDQNGRFVRYTVSMNLREYQYLIAKKLWTKAGQSAAGNLSFPASQNPAGSVGAMEFKAAWKVLGPKDVPSHFLTQQAIVYNDADGSVSPGPNPVTVGLVGLHITQKTVSQNSQALWSTFVQTDLLQGFNNPACPPATCPPNVETAPTPYVELLPNGKPINKPVQIVPIVAHTGPAYTAAFQKLLAGTPFAHYALISTQWSGEQAGFHPPTLGNPVLETFVAQVQPYSCMGCHQAAVTTSGANADFSWMMLEPQQ